MKHFFRVFAFSGSMLLSCGLQAANYNPASALELQNNLTEAAANGEDDTINLSGTFNVADAGGTFTFNSVQSNALTITGAGTTSTSLNGGGSARIMLITSSGSVTITGVTFQNGLINNANAGGLLATAPNITLQNNAFTGNSSSGTGNTGGVGLIATGSVIFSNNTLTSNSTAGNYGGLFLEAATATLSGNTFTQNSAEDAAGGCYIETLSGDLTLNNNTFDSNTADSDEGGACITDVVGNITFTDNVVTNNSAGDVGGIELDSSSGTVTVTGNTISNNTATDSSSEYGGIYARSIGNLIFSNNTVSGNSSVDGYAGAFVYSGSGSAEIDGNMISSNSTDSRSGIYTYAATGLIFSNNQVLSNESLGDEAGGLLTANGGDVQIINNLIVGNTAVDSVAAFTIESTSSSGSLNLINNTIFGNTTSSNGIGGISVTAPSSSVTINAYNNIFYGNNNDGTTAVGVDAFFQNTSGNLNVFNNDLGDVCFALPLSCDVSSLGSDAGNNLLNIDPDFINVASGNYRLQSASGLIDVGLLTAPGLPDTDIVGNPRSFLTIPDIGAYEAVAEISASSTDLDFGSVSTNDSNTLLVTLSNNGSYALTVTGFTLSDTANFVLMMNAGSDACGSTSFPLASGESCTFGIEFSPNEVQAFSESLTIASDAPANPAYVFNLAGSGAAPGGCALTAVSGAGNLWSYASFVFSFALYALWRRKAE